MPATRPSLEEAQAWCHNLATTHYENFHVATFFLPKRFRSHFESMYAYCRVSDDLGDEVADPATALRLLNVGRDAGRVLRRAGAVEASGICSAAGDDCGVRAAATAVS